MTTENEQKKYPIATTDGYSYVDDTDEALGIETIIHENGNQSKRIKLSDGRTAIVRELRGREVDQITRHIGKEANKYLITMCAFCTKINGEKVIVEELEEMKGKDYNKIRVAASTLNF